MRVPSIIMTKRFHRSYRKASVSLQGLIEGATHDLVRSFREMRTDVKRGYNRLKHLQPRLNLLEVDISGANRMVVDVENDCIRLLDVGDHETIPRYTFGKYQIDKHDSEPANSVFWPDSENQQLKFFSRNPCSNISEYGTEATQEWLYFLSAQQSDVLSEVLNHLFTSDEKGRIAPIFIVGGPGTGKTSVLVNLLKQSIELGVDSKMRCSERMKEFIIAAAPDINANLLVTDSGADAFTTTRLMIVDDPNSKSEIVKNLTEWVAKNQQSAIVIGFDPCQLSDFDRSKETSGLNDDTFDALVSITGANVYGLDECYRQKAIVGTATQKALRALADSSPFLADHKISSFRDNHLGVNSLANNCHFPNPHGYVQVYESWDAEAINNEITRIRTQVNWRHWPSTLIVLDEEYSTDVRGFAALFSKAGLRCETVLMSDVESIKGLEYQHLVMFLSRPTFRNLEDGFHGFGQAKYAKYRLMRIPISRPKDSQVVFVST